MIIAFTPIYIYNYNIERYIAGTLAFPLKEGTYYKTCPKYYIK